MSPISVNQVCERNCEKRYLDGGGQSSRRSNKIGAGVGRKTTALLLTSLEKRLSSPSVS